MPLHGLTSAVSKPIARASCTRNLVLGDRARDTRNGASAAAGRISAPDRTNGSCTYRPAGPLCCELRPQARPHARPVHADGENPVRDDLIEMLREAARTK